MQHVNFVNKVDAAQYSTSRVLPFVVPEETNPDAEANVVIAVVVDNVAYRRE